MIHVLFPLISQYQKTISTKPNVAHDAHSFVHLQPFVRKSMVSSRTFMYWTLICHLLSSEYLRSSIIKLTLMCSYFVVPGLAVSLDLFYSYSYIQFVLTDANLCISAQELVSTFPHNQD